MRHVCAGSAARTCALHDSALTRPACDADCVGKIENVASGTPIGDQIMFPTSQCKPDVALCVYAHDGQFKRNSPLPVADIADTCYSSQNQLCKMCRYEVLVRALSLLNSSTAIWLQERRRRCAFACIAQTVDHAVSSIAIPDTRLHLQHHVRCHAS